MVKGKHQLYNYSHSIKFKGTEKDFEKWKQQWLKEQKLCKKFHCRHEATSCGVIIRCTCSIYTYQRDYGCEAICRDATCDDCVFQEECVRCPHGQPVDLKDGNITYKCKKCGKEDRRCLKWNKTKN